jgi:prepilin-type N-terminal cleavage/methylation domain-containing protein
MRNAFTLVEILVVIGVIALLTAIIIPAVAMLQRSAAETKDSKQLAEIGTAIIEWRAVIGKPRSQAFPGNLRLLAGLEWDRQNQEHIEHRHADLMPLSGIKKVFISEADPTQGTDPYHGAEDLVGAHTNVYEEGCSYFYEVSDATAPQDGWWHGYGVAPESIQNEVVTWADAKRCQLRYGNMDANGQYGVPFSEDVMPIIRCYHHHEWGGYDQTTAERVLNVAWSTRVFWSTPYWESDANPLIPRNP